MTGGTLVARVIPPPHRSGTRAQRLIERNLMVYRRTWILLLSGFFEPVFYLFAIGVGVGQLVGEVALPDGTFIPYAAFVAPALLATSAMNGAIYESTFNIFFKLRYGKLYDAVLATPMTTADVAIGEIGWAQIRGSLYAVGFVVVMAAFGLIESWWGILALPAALLIGFAFGAVGMAATSWMKSWQDFDLIQLFILPMFLFSGTFYPIDVYPQFLQNIIRLSPLYHGSELIRAFTLGRFDASLWGHALYLVVMGIIGVTVASRRLRVLLLK